MKRFALLAVLAGCGPRGTAPPARSSDPPARAVPVEIDWPDGGAPASETPAIDARHPG